MPDYEVKTRAATTVQFYWLPATVFLLIAALLAQVFNFNGLYGQDSHEYLRYTRDLYAYLAGGKAPEEFYWPVAFPLAGALLSFVLPSIHVLQMVSMLSAVTCYIFFGKTLNLLYPDGTQRQRYAFLWLLCSPLFIRSAFMAMPDAFCLAMLTGTVFFLNRHRKNNETGDLLAAVAMGIIVVQIRTSAIILLLPLLISTLMSVRKRFSVLFMILGVTVLAITPSIFLKTQFNLDLLRHPWLIDWSTANYFKRSFATSDGFYNYTLPNLAAVLALFFHPAFCFAAVIFLVFALRKGISVTNQWWLLALIVYLLFCAGIPFQNVRFLLPAFPVLLLILYPGFEHLFSYYKDRTLRLVLIVAVFLLQITLATIALSPVYEVQQEEISVAKEMKKMPPVNLYTFGIDAALHTYDVPQEVYNMWNYSSPMIEDGALILYNERRFGELYKGTPPALLMESLHKQHRLATVKSLPNGWDLYRVR